MNFSLPNHILKVINTIESVGGEAYLVGGGVRDMLLGQRPDDYDITTSLLPEKIIEIFERTVPTGISHGTVTVIIDNIPVEVTTYRTDGDYLDGRHPNEVSFVGNITDDLSRRDFTVNAIAFSPNKGIVDPFGGINDLNNSLLKAVGNAVTRFSEDALRILRLYRIACQKNFSIEKETEEAALFKATTLSNISRERISNELFKALLSDNPHKLSPIIKGGFLKFVGINEKEISSDLCNLPKDRFIRFFAFLEENGADFSDVCKNLKTDKSLLKFCTDTEHCIKVNLDNKTEVKFALKEYDEKVVRSSLILKGINSDIINLIKENNEPYNTSHLALTGNDLISIGITGKSVGKTLNKLLDLVIKYPQYNTKEILLDLVTK